MRGAKESGVTEIKHPETLRDKEEISTLNLGQETTFWVTTHEIGALVLLNL